ncbi:uncharacterized protein LOC111703506 [Eurytemora carolleeae]|uniref:uncharacterized protein LOC111703506 n=1 Tax=Eurytemora carolleeae TaxID=1294199 RepID=UPI000C76B8AC|nr:uncharacterized protein LOC111703506 [Eurytemora carolleeae]|eukprot:XP_023331228.1 uncharacterized protein LOC111703506 [Eurytemora affinis]
MPDKLMANEEFYEKLRSGLKQLSIPLEDQDGPVNYSKYSHHLGRAEFGTLRKRESTVVSRDASNERKEKYGSGIIARSRDTSGDRTSQKLNFEIDKTLRPNTSRYGTRKSSRQASELRSDSRMSDYSEALPDLEQHLFDQEDGELLYSDRERDCPSVGRTQSMLVKGAKAERPQINDTPSLEVLKKKEEVLRNMELQKQQIREAKAWIQNGLMGAVGFCMVVYLQSLEMIAGQ